MLPIETWGKSSPYCQYKYVLFTPFLLNVFQIREQFLENLKATEKIIDNTV